MLLQLNIQNFAIVRELEIDWHKGMTTITGETGAGKSIAIDALGLCLGDRATTNAVRPGTKKAELCATFDIKHNTLAKKWLENNELLQENECLLRRVISAEGRSKAYINGSQVPLVQLKEVGQYLINIHGQHDHQLITKPTEQRRLVDDYANHPELLNEVKYFYQQWQQLRNELKQLEQSKIEREAKKQLLQYQVNELNEFDLQPGEFITLEHDYKRQSHAQGILNETLTSLHTLAHNEQFNVIDNLRKTIDGLAIYSPIDPQLNSITNTLNEAMLQIEDASNELKHYHDKLELDPESYALIEERYSLAIQIAKKHQVAPENLAEFHATLQQEYASLNSDESRLYAVIDDIELAQASYLEAAKKLTQSREKSANELSMLISESLHELNMANGQFKVLVSAIEQKQLTPSGVDNIDFVVSLNPGQPLELLNKVASGGELSRISLAMQVILADKVITPSLIFDEVDVGISGPTAAMVGNKLQQLAQNTQVICVTHLPQVACKGHQQLFVHKQTDGEHTETTVKELNKKKRIEEIARLLAGDKITTHSLANAKELLAS